MNLKPGDFVKVIDEDHSGIVTKVEIDKVYLECEDGFVYSYHLNQIVKPITDGVEFDFSQSNEELNERISIGELSKLPIELHKQKWLIDLHLESLAPRKKFKMQHEALLFQLEVVKKCIEKAIQKRQRRIIFVHGIGKGRLRTEMRYFIDHHYNKIEYFDGDYRDFGFGATEVIIHDFNQDDFS